MSLNGILVLIVVASIVTAYLIAYVFSLGKQKSSREFWRLALSVWIRLAIAGAIIFWRTSGM